MDNKGKTRNRRVGWTSSEKSMQGSLILIKNRKMDLRKFFDGEKRSFEVNCCKFSNLFFILIN